MRVKIFFASAASYVEDAVNKFLEEHAGYIDDVQFSADEKYFNVLIVYKEK